MRSSAEPPHRSSSHPSATSRAPFELPAESCSDPPENQPQESLPEYRRPYEPAYSVCRERFSQHRLVLAGKLLLHLFEHLRIARARLAPILLEGFENHPNFIVD